VKRRRGKKQKSGEKKDQAGRTIRNELQERPPQTKQLERKGKEERSETCWNDLNAIICNVLRKKTHLSGVK
jgi:hypothetical protein